MQFRPASMDALICFGIQAFLKEANLFKKINLEGSWREVLTCEINVIEERKQCFPPFISLFKVRATSEGNTLTM